MKNHWKSPDVGQTSMACRSSIASIILLGALICCWFTFENIANNNRASIWTQSASSVERILIRKDQVAHTDLLSKNVNSSCLRSHHHEYFIETIDSDSDDLTFTLHFYSRDRQKSSSVIYLNGIAVGSTEAGDIGWNSKTIELSASRIFRQRAHRFSVDVINCCSCLQIGGIGLRANIPQQPYTRVKQKSRKRGPMKATKSYRIPARPKVFVHTSRDEASKSMIRELSVVSGMFDRPLMSKVLCRLTIFETMLPEPGRETDEIGCIPVSANSESETDDILIVNIPQEMHDSYLQEVQKGELFVKIENVIVSKNRIIVDDKSLFTVVEPPDKLRHLQIAEPTEGTKTMAIVRVSTSDMSPSATLSDLRRHFIGEVGSSRVSVRSQYKRCSMGKLNWIYAGGYDVVLNSRNASEFTSGSDFLAAAEEKLKQDLNLDASLATLADRVIYCLAPEPDNWIASAGVNHYRVNINSKYCLSLTVAMHELGHTLGLAHSAEVGAPYGDITGYMGYGDNEEEGPRKCFNGVHNWQLNWFSDRELQVNPYKPQFVTLSAFIDYKKSKWDEPAIINIGNKYYFQFNSARKFNKGTGEKANLVTVSAVEGKGSLGVAGLAVGEAFIVDNYLDSGRKLVVRVCQYRTPSRGVAEAMIVSVGIGSSYCKQWFASGGTAIMPERVKCLNSKGMCVPTYTLDWRQRKSPPPLPYLPPTPSPTKFPFHLTQSPAFNEMNASPSPTSSPSP